MEEIWKDIPGYTGLYQVSNLGRVKSLERFVRCSNGQTNHYKEKILKQDTRRGYKKVQLFKDGKQTNYFIHRLIAQNFIPNPENKPYIDHINTKRDDNRVENLRWVTKKENMNNPLSKKKMSEAKKGEKNIWYGKLGKDNPKSKAIYQISKEGNLIGKWEGMREVERYTGVKKSNIVKCCQGKYNTAGGYRWIYAENLDDFLNKKMMKNIQKKRTAI